MLGSRHYYSSTKRRPDKEVELEGPVTLSDCCMGWRGFEKSVRLNLISGKIAE